MSTYMLVAVLLALFSALVKTFEGLSYVAESSAAKTVTTWITIGAIVGSAVATALDKLHEKGLPEAWGFFIAAAVVGVAYLLTQVLRCVAEHEKAKKTSSRQVE